MAWYDNILGNKAADNDDMHYKLNPVQQYLQEITSSREDHNSYERYYEELEIVNRGVNMIVDDVAEIPVRVGGPTKAKSVAKNIKRAKVDLLLNLEPNLYQDVSTFKRQCITDYLLDGNIFMYFDGVHLYHIPAD
jgi:phage portal protein BeeE